MAVRLCRGTNTEVSCVLAFPHGVSTVETKLFEAKQYIEKGVVEIDMVVNYSKIKSADWTYVEDELRSIVQIVKKFGVMLKVIFETCYLSTEEIDKATKICIAVGADYVKTSTGFGTTGATFEAVQTMLNAAEGKIKVKASGGIRDRKTADKYLDMGVERLGVNFTAIEALCSYSEDKSEGNY
jgi:deoxyribose-phosphate aldolase